MGNSDVLNSTQNLVHPDWELVDPTPNIHILFPLFDNKFFQNKLQCVTLEWSKKMYSCAGICYQKSTRFGKSCIIRLSEPLLKLRARKDVVETLLHEMIHAYCFVLGIREGNGGHGPNFLKLMHGINKIAGTNISVYHTFHDEVKAYKTHWWQCNGVCKNRKPFFGMVKRTANRAPGPNDRWWREHELTCGGKFVKIKEPEPKRKKAQNKENTLSQSGKPSQSNNKNSAKDIRNFFNNNPKTTNNNFKKPFTSTASNPGGRTVVVRKPPTTATKINPPSSPSLPTKKKPTGAGGNLSNVFQFKDIPDSDDEDSPSKKCKTPIPLFKGNGFVLGGGVGSSNRPGNPRNSRLLGQFSKSPAPSASKKRRTTVVSDEDIVFVESPAPETIDLCDDNDFLFENIDIEEAERRDREMKKEENKKRQDLIKKEILESFSEDDMEDIVLIDDEYDDDYNHDDNRLNGLDDSLTDTSVIDELFNDNDDLMEDFNQSNAQIKAESHEDEVVSCPMCLNKMKRFKIAEHLERCYCKILGEEYVPKTVKKVPKSVETKEDFDINQPSTSKASTSSPKPSTSKSKNSPTEKEIEIQLLRDAGYTDKVIAAFFKDQNVEKVENEQLLVDEVDLTAETCECPVCSKPVKFDQINTHLDNCLG